jgi:hypothetical protein
LYKAHGFEEYSATEGVFATFFDLEDDFGVAVGESIRAIRILQMTEDDRMFSETGFGEVDVGGSMGSTVPECEGACSTLLFDPELLFVLFRGGQIVADTPRAAAEGVEQDLTALLPTGENSIDDKIEKAVEKIAKSLNPDYWNVEGTQAVFEGDGKKIFDEQKGAIHELEDAIENAIKKGFVDLASDLQTFIDRLLVGLEELALNGIDKALLELADVDCAFPLPTGDGDCDHALGHIVKAEDDKLVKAETKYGEGDYEKAADELKHAWEEAEKAYEHALDMAP